MSDDIWWQVYPLGFVGAEPTCVEGRAVAHRLGHLHGWLDYAADLGVTGLLLGPIFASATHGYDTIDHRRIDPRLGDERDFDALVEAAHRRGLKLLLDGVFNHVGRDHPAFREVLRDGPGAPRANWFKLSWPRGDTPGAEPDYACFEGHRQLVTLNHDEPAVAEHVTEIMSYWLGRGAAGWRLDAAYAVPRRFWAGILPRVRAAHSAAYIVGEVIHGDYAGFVRDTGVDAVTQYELWKAIWSSLNDRNFFELAHALGRHVALLPTFSPMTFVGNHDVTRIATALNDPRHLPHAVAILALCAGTPSLYAGDEQGFRGLKEHRAGGDDAIRPAFPPTPSDLPPDGWPIYRLHQILVALRRRHPRLRRAPSSTVHLANRQIVLRFGDGEGALLLALNVADDDAELPAPGARAVEAGAAALSGEGTVRLGPQGWAVLSI